MKYSAFENLEEGGSAMASLLRVSCLFCAYKYCGAVPLTKEVLAGIEKQDRKVFDGIISMNMLYVFCESTGNFRVIKIMR